MKKNSTKRAAENRVADKWRLALCQAIERCEYCGKRRPYNAICVHEILCGPLRRLAMDKEYAVLVVCALECHAKVALESDARQLARLYHSRGYDYDLEAFHALRKRVKPEQHEVDTEIERLTEDVWQTDFWR
jgi:hypothetical protein